MRRGTIALASALFVLIVFPVAAHAQYPPNSPTCVVDRSTAAPDDTVNVTGDQWAPDSSVAMSFHQSNPAVDHSVGSASANSAGTFVAPVHIPTDAHNGPATLTLSGSDSSGAPATCDVGLTITGGPTSACAQVSDDRVNRAQNIQVFSAEGCWEPDSTARVFFHSAPVFLGETTVRADGSFSLTVKIPADALLGAHDIEVHGVDANGTPAVRIVPIEVVAGGGPLAFTGIALWGLLALAVALFATGATLLAAARAAPVDMDHPALRQELQRRTLHARVAVGSGLVALAAWLAFAVAVPGAPTGLSLRHPVSVGTTLLALLAGMAAWSAVRTRRAEH